MTPEAALLYEVWETVKGQIAQKERLHIAEAIVVHFEEQVGLDPVDIDLNEFDSVMKAALLSHFEIEDDEEEEDY